MATLMRFAGGVCTGLEPTWTVRISRYVRRSPLTVRPESESSGVRDPRVKSLDSAPVSETERSVGQRRGDEARAASLLGARGHPRKTESGEAALPSRFPRLNQIDGLRYEKAQPGDKRLSRLVNLARSKKLREQQGKILLEGRRLISEALDAGASPQTIFFTAMERLQELPLSKLTQAGLIRVKPEDIRIWSDVDPPQDLIAVFKRPEVSQMQFSEEKYGKALPLTLICDNVRDPGNLGTALHCAAAAGCRSVLLTKGCVDIWEPKVLRVAMGAHFCLPIIPSLTWTDIQTHLPANTTVHVADNCRGTIKEPEFSAASQQQKKAGDYGWVSSHHNPRKIHYEDDFNYDEDYKEDSCRSTRPVLDTQPYHIRWAGRHTAVVIGGETHGLSHEALHLAGQTGGHRLLIPMVQGVDSLNSAMATSVLLFEGRRQLMHVTE
ncbi:rRNA methyltransferase 3B, mitochondrial [Pygocentrus nattereri]|uniref:RNA 2-O ribose methyltransferase substrate binding domain-containing protein n=1 Tax=Pygocentrus nattereri TaxID=42514 RepID=A0A3B4E0A3_PYGNA|nr:rRNA methyltransferase 3B, mitochondrial [Pygocentrus nattereri]